MDEERGYRGFMLASEEIDGLWFVVIEELLVGVAEYWDETAFYDTEEEAFNSAIEMIDAYLDVE